MPLIDRAPVSGCYRGAGDRFRVELRVDVDGRRTTRRVSADYYDGDSYRGSMRVDAPSIVVGSDGVTISGRGVFSWPTRFESVHVSVSRSAGAPPTAALSHRTPDGVAGAVFACRFHSPSFREATLEEGVQSGVKRFESYDSAALPSGGPARTISVHGAFADAGIELAGAAAPTEVEVAAAGADGTWSDAELHAAMEEYFSRLADRPQWAIWLLHAWAHDDPNLRGLMFDRRGRHRQGCAVFYEPLSGTDAPTVRNQLHACMHELGHGFNLMHCWQPSQVTPPLPSRPDATTWMNYPDRFPGGEPAFWPRFAFEFDAVELAHLRHGFQDEVIMGGRPFGAGSARGSDNDDALAGSAPANALRMRIDAPRTFVLGAPISLDVALSVPRSGQSERVSAVIGPRPGNVDVVITRPDGSQHAFEPLLRHCRGEDARQLGARDGPLVDHAFIHYGKDGFAFERPGRYAVRARYTALDGSSVLSNALAIVVTRPATSQDGAVARLVAHDPGVGKLLSLVGSAAPALDDADRALQEVIDRHPAHAMAAVARLVRATSVGRDFKLVQPDGRVQVRPSDTDAALALVRPVIDFAAVLRAVPEGLQGEAQERAVARALSLVGTRPGVPPIVGRFIDSRRREIARFFTTAIAVTVARRRRPPGAAALAGRIPRKPDDPSSVRQVPQVPKRRTAYTSSEPPPSAA
jgi:hypothetical protein